MAAEDSRTRLTRDWFTHVQRDLASSDRLLAEPALPAEAAFHVQQAIEKTLKGLLAWHNIPFTKTHDLDELLGQCAAVVPEILTYRLGLAPFARFAVDARYPGYDPEPDVEDVRAALELARQIAAFVPARLPSNVWP